jgi:hypothetical protein
MHLKPTAGCQISTLIFEKIIVEGELYKFDTLLWAWDAIFHLGIYVN